MDRAGCARPAGWDTTVRACRGRSPDRLLAVAGAWALDDSVLHVELLATDYVADPLQALQWVVERAGRGIPVVIDGASPAASMIPALHAQKCKVITTTAVDGESLRRLREPEPDGGRGEFAAASLFCDRRG